MYVIPETHSCTCGDDRSPCIYMTRIRTVVRRCKYSSYKMNVKDRGV